jgi:hypothetical protein
MGIFQGLIKPYQFAPHEAEDLRAMSVSRKLPFRPYFHLKCKEIPNFYTHRL